MIMDDQNKIAAATAHRACCGTEHDPENGKLHGFCVVCGVPWPCDTAKLFLVEDVEEDKSPRFDKTYCSQCGGGFGPGEHGYSDCRDHENITKLED